MNDDTNHHFSEGGGNDEDDMNDDTDPSNHSSDSDRGGRGERAWIRQNVSTARIIAYTEDTDASMESSEPMKDYQKEQVELCTENKEDDMFDFGHKYLNFDSGSTSRELKDAPGSESDDDEKSQFGCALEEGSSSLDYPALRKLISKSGKVERAYSIADSAVSNYRPPQDATMGPVTYPPASGSARQPPKFDIGPIKIRANEMTRGLTSNMWSLPPAQGATGAMLILPDDIGQYDDVIARWESVTLNYVNAPDKVWPSNKAKVEFIENLLGEIEKKAWIQWRMMYANDYNQLIDIADDTQNIISQIRRVFTLRDPYQGDTEEHNRAYTDLDRLVCKDMKDIWRYLNDYKILAAKSES